MTDISGSSEKKTRQSNPWVWLLGGVILILVCLLGAGGLLMVRNAQQASANATVLEEAHLIAAATGKAKDDAATQASANALATQASINAAATEQMKIALSATPTQVPSICVSEDNAGEKVKVHWFIGLGTGTDPSQITTEQSVVDDFNASQDKIELVMDVIPYTSAKDTLLTKIASGDGPDIIGPVGWNGAAAFHGQWLDLSTCIAHFDTSDFSPALLENYVTPDEGQVALPFAVYPSAIYYNTALFDKAGLAYPPAKYGEKYSLDGQMVDWDWETTVKQVAQRLTLDSSGKNATQSGFNKNSIVQYGFSYNFESQPSYIGTYWGPGSFTAADGKTAQIPPAWLDSWKWFYDGIWGEQPFIPSGSVAGSGRFGSGNTFNSRKIAMIVQPAWYTCCLSDVKTWDLGAMPSYHGKVSGRVDADTFRIWKGTRHPGPAFQVLTYLVTTGVQKLIIGSNDMPAAYGSMPARVKETGPWVAAKKAQFSWVKNWDVLVDGLNYPDTPSAEAYMPNYSDAWARTGEFYARMANTGGLDLESEANTFLADLQAIFDK